MLVTFSSYPDKIKYGVHATGEQETSPSARKLLSPTLPTSALITYNSAALDGKTRLLRVEIVSYRWLEDRACGFIGEPIFRFESKRPTAGRR